MPSRRLFSLFLCLAVVGILTIPCVSAWAEAMPTTASIITVTATSSSGSATFEEVFPVLSFDGVLTWNLPSPLALADGANTLGEIEDLQVTFDADPQVDLAFALKNSSLTDPVTFQDQHRYRRVHTRSQRPGGSQRLADYDPGGW